MAAAGVPPISPPAASTDGATAPPPSDISILIVTWNVGHKPPSEAELAVWLGDDPQYDLVAIGTQENAFKAKNDGAGGKKKRQAG